MCKENMDLYNKFRSVPEEAKKEIGAGRLKGKTDINPMWRIRVLTEAFGPCGDGWKTTNVVFWTTQGANGEVIAFCSLDLLYRIPEIGEWSDPIFGIGGSMAVSQEKSGLYADDDCYKKAYTDAISVACKALGIGADVYWEKDPTKYTIPQYETYECVDCGKAIGEKLAERTLASFGVCLCKECGIKRSKANENKNEVDAG